MSDKANQDSKDSGGGSSEYITLRVVNQDSNEIHFRVKICTKLGKLMKNYCEKVGAPVTSLRFLLDGRRVHDDDTAGKLGMQHEDVIEVYSQQSGGGVHGGEE